MWPWTRSLCIFLHLECPSDNMDLAQEHVSIPEKDFEIYLVGQAAVLKIFKAIQELVVLGSSVAIGQLPDVLYLLEVNRRILWHCIQSWHVNPCGLMIKYTISCSWERLAWCLILEAFKARVDGAVRQPGPEGGVPVRSKGLELHDLKGPFHNANYSIILWFLDWLSKFGGHHNGMLLPIEMTKMKTWQPALCWNHSIRIHYLH